MNAEERGLKRRELTENAEERGLKHRELTEKIIGVFYEVYNELGHGFLESVYEEAMAVALPQAGLKLERQVPLRVTFRGAVVGDFRADLLVENAVLLELKAAREICLQRAASTARTRSRCTRPNC